MTGSILSVALPAFLASLVEFVEALTIVLAVGATRGWRAAWAGTAAGIVLLAIVILAFGPALARVPLAALQLTVGIMLLFFGMRWLRKAVLRYAGVIALHDEALIYERRRASLAAGRMGGGRLDWQGAATTFNAVVLEGLEVVFIVIALGATAGALVPATLGAAAAAVLVAIGGFALKAPLANVPENTLKYVVGVMLSAFGTFWTAEGLHVPWPGNDLALLGLIGRISSHVGRRYRRSPERARGAGREFVRALRAAGTEILGLFVEDWVFALAIALWLAVVAGGAALAIGAPEARGVVLFAGLACILFASVTRAARGR